MMRRQRLPALAAYGAVCLAAALWIDFSRHHDGHHSDSLVPVLVSTQHWTPFYWEQSRFGMLVPLLAMPIAHPLYNLLLQNAVTIFAGLMALGLLARFTLGRRRWLPVALASVALWLLLLPPALRFEYFAAQPYGVSLALGLAALVVIEGCVIKGRIGLGRGTIALALMVLASWVNLMIGPLLLVVIAMRTLVHRAWRGRHLRRAVACTLLTTAGTAAGFAFEAAAPERDPQQSRAVRTSRWLPAVAALVQNAWGQVEPGAVVAGLLLGAAGTVGFANVRRRADCVAFRGSTALLLAAGLTLLFIARSRWVALNGHAPRYLLPALAFLIVGMAAGVAPMVQPVVRRRRWALHALAVVPLAVAALMYGTPSGGVARDALNRKLGRHTAALLDHACTHVAGGYWSTWTTVFHANWKLHEQGASRRLQGVAARAAPVLHSKPPDESGCVVAVLEPDPAAELCLQRFFPPLRLWTVSAAFEIYRPAPEP